MTAVKLISGVKRSRIAVSKQPQQLLQLTVETVTPSPPPPATNQQQQRRRIAVSRPFDSSAPSPFLHHEMRRRFHQTTVLRAA